MLRSAQNQAVPLIPELSGWEADEMVHFTGVALFSILHGMA